jgi:AcrR family transcriptional regulator
MARSAQAPENKRRIPRQARAAETVAAILEATAQVLEAGGLAALTTNAVAARAGVSIGTLYQYFDDKNAILLALARREMTATVTRLARDALPAAGRSPEERVRAAVRAILDAFRGRMRARKAVVQAILAQGLAVELTGPVADFVARHPSAAMPNLSREQVFVLSRALMGTIRAAVMEEQPFLRSAAFEDELVRLAVAYLGSITGPSAAAR